MPGHSNYACHRTVHSIACTPLQEAVDDEIADNPSMLHNLDSQSLDHHNWCNAYIEHPVVQASVAKPIPIAIYLDGVSYSNIDSVIGFWCVNLFSGARHFLAPIRKRLLCRCGCKGWCSFWAIFNWLSSCVSAGESGIYPESRHDRKPWNTIQDAGRKLKGGLATFRKLALLFIKGDWAEIANTCALSSWASKIRPCFKCNAFRRIMYEFARQFLQTTSFMYDKSCTRAEILVTIADAAERDDLLCYLKYFKGRARGGRIVKQNANRWSLKMFDTLEPSTQLMDISTLEYVTAFPLTIVFWRRSLATICKHRNPLLEGRHECLAIDAMHTLHLGVWKQFLAFFINMAILADAFWKRSSCHSDFDHLQMSVMRIKESISSFYDKYAHLFPLEQLTRITNLTEKHIGVNRGQPFFKAKAAQTWGVILWAYYFCLDFTFDNPNWCIAVEALVQYWRVCQKSPRKLSATEHGSLLSTMTTHLTAIKGLLPYIPKHHLWLHLSEEAGSKGNPVYYDTFVDETLNRLLKQACMGAHQCTFEQTVNCRMKDLLSSA